MFRIVELVSLILLPHGQTSSFLVLGFVMKVSLLIRKSLKTLGTTLVVWLLLGKDPTYMACYYVAMRRFIGAIMNQFQIRHINIHLSYYFSNRPPKFSINSKLFDLFRIL